MLERHTIGWGASSRNGGFVLPGYKPDLEVLARRLGVAEARRLYALSVEAVEALEAVIANEAIECDYARCGTVVLAARPGHLAGLERSRRFLRHELGHETTLLSPSELAAEIGSTRYTAGSSTRSPVRCSRPAWCRGWPGPRSGRARGSPRGWRCWG